MLSEAAQLIEKAKLDENVMVVVLRGAGEAFSAGVDLRVLQGIQPDGGIIGNVFDEPAAKLATAIRDSGAPVIARAVGACFTGALEIALHCDFVYTTNATRFGDTHTKFGPSDLGYVSNVIASSRTAARTRVVVHRYKKPSMELRLLFGVLPTRALKQLRRWMMHWRRPVHRLLLIVLRLWQR